MEIAELLMLSQAEKAARFDAMAKATFSHVNGRDLLAELHPRSELNVWRRQDGRSTWFEADWLTTLMYARDDTGFKPIKQVAAHG